MSLRAKLFPALVFACAAALVLVCFAQYRRGVRALDDALRADAEARARRFARALEAHDEARAGELFDLGYSPVVLAFYARGGRPTSGAASATQSPAASPPAPAELLGSVSLFLARHRGDCSALTFVVGPDSGTVLRFEQPLAAGESVSVKWGDAASGGGPFKGMLSSPGGEAVLTPEVKRAINAQGTLVYLVPISRQPEGRLGALAAEFKPDALAGVAAREDDPATGPTAAPSPLAAASRAPFQMIALGRGGLVVYHPNDALKFQTVARVMPYFDGVASEMAAGREGSRDYADADGARWIAAYAPVRDLDLSVAVAADETKAVAPLRREGLIYVAISALLASAVVALVVAREVRSARRIGRIAQAARAVAEGDLDRRLEADESDRAYAIAQSFNLMTERLREHIRREAEDRQLQAFVRLSATLTHDLKNSIAALSMLVSNMERRWEREEFRADAIESLREAAAKLQGIVARLNKPVETLSGEYRRSLKPVDLSAVVRRVVESTAGRSSFHEVRMNLPEGLEVIADVDRLERVFENLVINALEAMGASEGRLTVAGGREGELSVFVSVADTGAGMTPEFIRTKLFRPFSTTKKQGLGLGLYTCREVVEAHGGRIEVESRPSSGTRFRVVLPSRPISLPRETKT